MPDKQHTYFGFVTLDGTDDGSGTPGIITFTNASTGAPANRGDPGSVLNWNGLYRYPEEDVDSYILDVNDDGVLIAGGANDNTPTAGKDYMHIPADSYPFSGYTITVNGVDYPIFQFPSYDYFVPLPVDGSVNGIIPTSGTSNVYQSSASGTFLCFGAGTGIMTPKGEVKVETLQIGDEICTAEHQTKPVTWVGRQTLSKWLHGAHMQPVRIRAGALGGGLPHSDLIVTADHGMIIDDLVINASALVNGGSVDFVPLAELGDSFTVYHIETENHDVILANGAPSETFIDMAGRSAFDNYPEYLDLYGAERIIREGPLPRIAAARLVPQAIKDRLNVAPKLTGAAA